MITDRVQKIENHDFVEDVAWNTKMPSVRGRD